MAVSTATEKLLVRQGPSTARPVMDIGEPFMDTDTMTPGFGNGTTNPILLLNSTGKQVLSKKMFVEDLPVTTFNTGTAIYSLAIDNPYIPTNPEGLIVKFVINANNPGPTKLKLNEFNEADMVTNAGQSLSAGQLSSGMVVEAVFKSSVWRILNLGGASSSNVTSTGTNSNTFSVGNGSAGNKELIANTDAVNKPRLRWDDTAKSWTFSNDGINFSAISSRIMSSMFDTSLSNTAFYVAQTTQSTAWSAPSTTGVRHVIRSVTATNIGSTDSSITLETVMSSGAGTIALAHQVPVPTGGAVELLLKPKVYQPGDNLVAVAGHAATVQLTITYSTISDTSLWTTGADFVTANTMLDLRVGQGQGEVLESILLANDDGVSPVDVQVAITDSGNNVQGYLVFNYTVSPKSTVEVLDAPKFLAAGYKLRALATSANRLEVTVTGRTKT